MSGGAAPSGGFAMPGVAGTPSASSMAGSLPSFIDPSQITGVSVDQAQPSTGGGFSPSSLMSGAGGNHGSIGTPVNAGLQLASMIPGPQQPFVAGAAMAAPIVESLFGGGQSSGVTPSSPPIPQRPVAAGSPQLASPVSSTSVAPTGSLTPWQSGQNMSPALMQLLARLTGGKGTV